MSAERDSTALDAWRETFEAVPTADGQTQMWLEAPVQAPTLADCERAARALADERNHS